MTRITGQAARDLLDIWEGDEDGLIAARHGAYGAYGDLFAAAPGLAETLVWLYGRRVNGLTVGEHLTSAGSVQAVEGDVVASVGTFPPDEAVDLARALLAAAEEARQ